MTVSIHLLGASIILPILRFCCSNHSNFFLFFLSKNTFQVNFMWLCKCKYICMQVCIYVNMFLLPTFHNILMMKFSSYTKRILILFLNKFLFLKHMVSLVLLIGENEEIFGQYWTPYSLPQQGKPSNLAQYRPKLQNLISDDSL